jgi:BlaI family transcriptional regulator, penicillinase repressor
MIVKELTKAEEQVMHCLWSIEKGFLKDILDKFPDPKPAYTTVSTVIRVLVKKEFIGYTTYGKTHQYHPLVSKSNYFKSRLRPKISSYFSGSSASLASYFANEKLNLSELEEIREIIEGKIKKLKAKKK